MNSKKVTKWSLIAVAGLFLAYVGSIVWFEVQLGVNQPQGSTSIVIATFSGDNERHERVVRLEQIEGGNYIAANHWPRAWYHQALDNPNIEVKMPGEDSFAPYLAVPLEGAEEEHIAGIYTFDFNFRFRTGFPPRYFIRLEEKG
ncbi:MAG: hypothetical protein DHS20C12_25210 [Pseudohongiella sp.]|nr:MAG: hypothetical protein DHS20C12_25210 [Pseudohongiella sp.]